MNGLAAVKATTGRRVHFFFVRTLPLFALQSLISILDLGRQAVLIARRISARYRRDGLRQLDNLQHPKVTNEEGSSDAVVCSRYLYSST